jgi:hypothetical protein
MRVGHSTSPDRLDVVAHACVIVFVFWMMTVVPGATVTDVANDATVSVRVIYFVAVAMAVVPLIDSETAVMVSNTVWTLVSVYADSKDLTDITVFVVVISTVERSVVVTTTVERSVCVTTSVDTSVIVTGFSTVEVTVSHEVLQRVSAGLVDL